MRIFSIGDLHLSLSMEKPMDLFGDVWRDHPQKLRTAWKETVHEDDWVLIPGDISWAMNLDAALLDLLFLGELPGKKLILRGNHDYWWSSHAKMLSVLPRGVFALQNDSICLGDITVCGTRGWSCPGTIGFSETDQKIYNRELKRLEFSLKTADSDANILLMLHFPPFNERKQDSGFTELIECYNVKIVVYAHLHGVAQKSIFEGERNETRYIFVASDYLNFKPKLIV